MQDANRGRLTFDDFVLDLDAAELSQHGRAIAIEPQVFDLVAFLASNPGRVLTRDDIIEAVWDGRIVSDSAVSTRINAARKALGDDGSAQRIIKTVHGRGFRFEAKPAAEAANSGNGFSEPQPLDVRYCRTPDGVNLAFAETGAGQPLVKAASFMTHLQHDSEGIVFRDWIAEFAGHYRYIRYDERGNGLSDLAIDSFSFEAMVADLETVVDAMELDKFALLGTSQGAPVSIEYAARHPDRVGCLIILGGFAQGWQHSTDKNFHAVRTSMMGLVRTTWGADNPAGRQAFAAYYLPEGTPEQHSEFMRLQQVTTSPDNAYRILDTFSRIDVTKRLPQIATPTLVMHCDGDAPIPFEEGRLIAAGIPGARFVMLEGNNHIIQKADRGWGRFSSEIQRFMAEHMGDEG